MWPKIRILFQGFVSVLDTPAVMYIWDQCFMQGWQPSVLKHTSLAILELLREKFMNARDYSQMKEVWHRELKHALSTGFIFMIFIIILLIEHAAVRERCMSIPGFPTRLLQALHSWRTDGLDPFGKWERSLGNSIPEQTKTKVIISLLH